VTASKLSSGGDQDKQFNPRALIAASEYNMWNLRPSPSNLAFLHRCRLVSWTLVQAVHICGNDHNCCR